MERKPVLFIAGGVLAAALLVWLYLHHRSAAVAVVPPPVAASAEALPPEESIAHPLPAEESGSAAVAAPLPALTDSDAALGEALAKLAGPDAVRSFLRPEDVVRHIVVTIDNLPRQKVAVEKRPTPPVPGTLVVDGDELHAVLDAGNAERYKPMVAVISRLDARRLASLYIHYYPLFQQSYQDLGYPNGYFNDRLVQVIDLLLATPQLARVELTRPNVMYTFADPKLEALPAGQKLLIRMGPENAAAIKRKLMELRTAVTAAPPQH
jgi:Protein of unknown function (DUF3014)